MSIIIHEPINFELITILYHAFIYNQFIREMSKLNNLIFITIVHTYTYKNE